MLWRPWKGQVNYSQMARISTKDHGVTHGLLANSHIYRLISKCIFNCFHTDCPVAENPREVHLLEKRKMTAQRRKQVKEGSEKNLRISTWRWNPFHKMCMFTLQGPTGLAAYTVSVLFLTEPWFGWWEGGPVFSISLTAEGGYVLVNEMHWKLPGFLWDLLKAGLPLLACPSSIWKAGTALRVAHSSCNHKSIWAR